MAQVKKRESGESRKGLILAYVMLALVSISILLYLKQVVLPRQQHEFSSFLIRISSHHIMNICREFAEIEVQQKNLELAEQLGDRNLADAYLKQIEARQKGLQAQVSDYQELILKLGDFREDIVHIEFTAYTQVLIKEKAFSKVHAIRLVKSDYHMLAARIDSVNPETIYQACKENLINF